jgi:hypothetical protein
MNMQYSTPELSEGRVNKQKAEETPNTFATQDGVSKLERSAPLDKTSVSRMAGNAGARAMQMMTDPIEQQRVADWMGRFGMTNQGMEWNQAKMMGGMPPPPGA